MSLNPEEPLAVERAGGVFLRADIGAVETPQRMIALALQLFGRVDGLVANAGLTIPQAFLEMTVEVLDQMWRVNQRGAALSAQAAARIMVAAGKGAALSLSGQTMPAATCRGTKSTLETRRHGAPRAALWRGALGLMASA